MWVSEKHELLLYGRLEGKALTMSSSECRWQRQCLAAGLIGPCCCHWHTVTAL